MSDPMSVSRRLIAVFAADVEGYSRLMGADEVGTLKGLTERRAILDTFIGKHRGRIARAGSLWDLQTNPQSAVLIQFVAKTDEVEHVGVCDVDGHDSSRCSSSGSCSILPRRFLSSLKPRSAMYARSTECFLKFFGSDLERNSFIRVNSIAISHPPKISKILIAF